MVTSCCLWWQREMLLLRTRFFSPPQSRVWRRLQPSTHCCEANSTTAPDEAQWAGVGAQQVPLLQPFLPVFTKVLWDLRL